jgi:hypothetical protein
MYYVCVHVYKYVPTIWSASGVTLYMHYVYVCVYVYIMAYNAL